MFIGRTDAAAEAPILWPPDMKSQFTGKYRDTGKDGKNEERGTARDVMVGWNHQFNGHAFEQTLGDSEGQGSVAYCNAQCCKELDTTEPQNNNNYIHLITIESQAQVLI